MFFDKAILECITDFTNIKIGLLHYLFERHKDAKEIDLIEIRMVFGLLYMAGMMYASHINIDDFYQTDDTGVELSIQGLYAKKTTKFGIKVYGLVDVTSHYVFNFEIYAGQQPVGNFWISNLLAGVIIQILIQLGIMARPSQWTIISHCYRCFGL